MGSAKTTDTRTMSISLNAFSFTGRAGRDAEIRYFDDGRSVASIPVAINLRQRKGEDVPPVWVEVSLWGKRAQAIADCIRKGDLLAVAGELQAPEAFTDKTGNARYRLRVSANEVAFLQSPSREQRSAAPAVQPATRSWESSELPF